MNLSETRAALAEALAPVSAVIYPYPPAVVLAPSVTVVPAEPYIEPMALGTSRYRARFQVTAAVNMNDNQAALDNLETLLFAIYAALPSGWTIGDSAKPSVLDLGQSKLLSSDLVVEIPTQVN